MFGLSRVALTVVLAVVVLMIVGAQPCSAQEMYIGQIIMVGWGTAPAQVPENFLPCDGRVLQIAQNQALYSLLSTTYGGNGQTTFQLPDLRNATIQIGDKKVPVKYFICTQGLYPSWQ